MRILFFIDSLAQGGAQRQMVTLSKLFNQIGYDVSFLIYHEHGFFKHDLIDNGLHVHHCKADNYLSRTIKVRNYIRKNNFDTVISFLEVPNFLNCISAIGRRKWRVIISERSSKEANLTSRRGKVFGWFYRFSDAIICNSYNAKNLWLKYYPKYKDKLHVIYNPTILPAINSKYIPKRDGKLNIVIAASYQYLKNPIGLVKALSLLDEEERKQLRIDWYGYKEISIDRGRAYEATLSLVCENNLQNIIYLHDATKEIANRMYEADFVALFSELEGLPNVICEGMMLGKPIIMSRVSDYNTLIDEKNGFLCDWDNPSSIKEALVKAMKLSNQELLSMGERSKEKAEKLFSVGEIFDQWHNLM